MPRATAFENIEVLAAGGTDIILSTSMTEKIILSTSGAIVMAGNYTLTTDGAWAEGSEVDVLWSGSATLGAFNITLFGYPLTQAQATAGNLEGTAYAKSGSVVFTPKLTSGSAQVGTADIAALAVTTAKIDNLAVTSGKLAASAVIAGKINAGAIVNADVNAAAAIAYSKLNLGTSILNADINANANIAVSKLEAASDGEMIFGVTATGKFTKLPMSADVLVAATGAATVQAGVITPAKTTTNLTDEPIEVDVSFETGEQGNNTVVIPFNFTILSMYAIVTKAAGGTDTGTITARINGNPVTTGQITVAISAAVNTEYTVTPSAANSGSAGDELESVTLKTTVGGHAKVTYKLRRTS